MEINGEVRKVGLMILFGLTGGVLADAILSYLMSRRMGYVDLVVIGSSLSGVVIGQYLSRRALS